MIRPLTEFQNDPERKALYRQAIELLERARIREVLMDAGGAPILLPAKDPQALQMYAIAHAQRIGYYAAIDELYNLEGVANDSNAGERDYGARDALLQQGFSADEIDSIKDKI